MAEGVYARMVATPPQISIAGLEDEKVYAPLLLLTPDIIDVSEKETSVLYVLVICEMD
jgi:hypothetical protein